MAPSAPSRIAVLLGSFAVLAGCGLLLWARRSTGRSHEIYADVMGGRAEACCLGLLVLVLGAVVLADQLRRRSRRQP